MKSYEEQIIEFESCRNEAMDQYFNARPFLHRTKKQECLFESGFRISWKILKPQREELLDALQGMLDLYERLIPHIKDAPVTEEDVAAEQTAVELIERLSK